MDILYNTSGFIATENHDFIADAVFQSAGTSDQYISRDKRIRSQIELLIEEKELDYN